ncbi:MAG: hypothetical protein V4580_14520 [Bacteroidota bacterium]
MANTIFKRLVIAFSISFIVSMPYSFYQYNNAIAGPDAEGIGQLIIALNFALNIFNFLCSLPAFLNLNKYVRDFYILSFLSFCGAPLVILLGMLGIYLFGNTANKSMSDFLSIALPAVIFNAVLVYGFVKFRDNVDNEVILS